MPKTYNTFIWNLIPVNVFFFFLKRRLEMTRTRIEMKNNKQKAFDEAYHEFIGYCKVRNLRPATLKH